MKKYFILFIIFCVIICGGCRKEKKLQDIILVEQGGKDILLEELPQRKENEQELSKEIEGLSSGEQGKTKLTGSQDTEKLKEEDQTQKQEVGESKEESKPAGQENEAPEQKPANSKQEAGADKQESGNTNQNPDTIKHVPEQPKQENIQQIPLQGPPTESKEAASEEEHQHEEHQHEEQDCQHQFTERVYMDQTGTCAFRSRYYHKCALCGYVHPDLQEESTGGQCQFVELAPIREPTCSEWGTSRWKCTVCATEYNSTIPKLEHDLEMVVIEEGDCSREGIVEFRCKRKGCNYSYRECRWFHQNQHNLVTYTGVEYDALGDEVNYEYEVCEGCGYWDGSKRYK